jgi:hypothetical protein
MSLLLNLQTYAGAHPASDWGGNKIPTLTSGGGEVDHELPTSVEVMNEWS